MSKLIIIESPKRVNNYKKMIGEGYDIICNCNIGHDEEYYNHLLESGLIMREECCEEDKESQAIKIEELDKKIKESERVYLAMDDDKWGDNCAMNLIKMFKIKNYTRIRHDGKVESIMKEL